MAVRAQARKLIIKAILATDMTHHNDMVKDLADRAAESKPVEAVDVLQTFLHLADLGNCVVEWGLSKRWAFRVCEEATAQANREKELGLPVPPHVKLSAYNDHEVAARQLIFLDGWIRPLFKAAAILFPTVKSRLDAIEANRAACEAEMKPSSPE